MDNAYRKDINALRFLIIFFLLIYLGEGRRVH